MYNLQVTCLLGCLVYWFLFPRVAAALCNNVRLVVSLKTTIKYYNDALIDAAIARLANLHEHAPGYWDLRRHIARSTFTSRRHWLTLRTTLTSPTERERL